MAEQQPQSLSEILSTPAALVRQHRIDSDGEATVFRSGADLKDLLSIGIGMNCAQKKRVVAGVFGYRGVANNYPCTDTGAYKSRFNQG